MTPRPLVAILCLLGTVTVASGQSIESPTRSNNINHIMEERPAPETAGSTNISFPPFLRATIPSDPTGFTFQPKGLTFEFDNGVHIAFVYEEAEDIFFFSEEQSLLDIYTSIFTKNEKDLTEEYRTDPELLLSLASFKDALPLASAQRTGWIRSEGLQIFYYASPEHSEAFVFNEKRENEISRIAAQALSPKKFEELVNSVSLGG